VSYRRFVVLLGLLCLALAFAPSHTPEDIVVLDAELVVESPNTYSPDLANLIASVPPRFVIQYAEDVRLLPLPPLPGSLHNWLNQVGGRVVIQSAEENKQYTLAYPAALPQNGLPAHLHYSVIYLPMIRR
jgi:hypothetical protein